MKARASDLSRGTVVVVDGVRRVLLDRAPGSAWWCSGTKYPVPIKNMHLASAAVAGGR